MADALVDALVAPVRRFAPVNKGLFGIGANALPWPPPAGVYDPRRPILPPNPTEAKYQSLTAGPQEYTGAILPYRRDIGGNLHWAVPGIANSAVDAAALPGDVYAGRVDPMSDEGIGRANDLAGFVTLGAGAVPAEGNALRMGIKAYHGSPHDFDRFDLSKIGTGEGAQTYGHGLYFAEAEDVAKAYRDRLAQKALAIEVDGEKIAPIGQMGALPAKERAAAMLRMAIDNGEGPSGAILRAKTALRNAEVGDLTSFQREGGWGDVAVLRDVVQYLEKWRDKDIKPITGKMYEANINASPDEFLDWDKPLSEQSEKVRALLERLGHNADGVTGNILYRALQSNIGGARNLPSADAAAAVAKALREAGIKGIRYKDAVSRGGAGGTHNYVVFDDAVIDILRKYGIAGLIGGGAAAAGLTATPGSAEAATTPGDTR